MKDFQQQFPVVLFIASYKLILNINGIECHVFCKLDRISEPTATLIAAFSQTKIYFKGKLPRSSDMLSLTINDKHKN